MAHIYIALTLIFTVYGQLVIKWQIGAAGAMPPDFAGKVGFLFAQFLNPWILSGFASAFIAAMAWMAAMTHFALSYAYPFMSLAFILVMLFSIAFLREPLTLRTTAGTLLVMAGLALIAR
jgi:uncharacterized membrane protein